MTHEQKLFKDCLKEVKARWGSAFYKLGDEIQQALVRSEALSKIGAMESMESSSGGRLALEALRWSLENEITQKAQSEQSRRNALDACHSNDTVLDSNDENYQFGVGA